MTKQEIISKVKQLNLPLESYIVFGSCPLAAVGIRQAGDIDLLVSSEALNILRNRGWKQIEKSPDDKPFTYGDFEAHDSWKFSAYKPTLEQLLSTADFF